MMTMRKLLSAMVIVVSMGMIGSSLAQDYQKGLSASIAGDYATAAKEWKFLAERGDTDAAFALASMYVMGRGFAQDWKEAVVWFRKAAELGHAHSQYSLASAYANGLGVIQDDMYAHMWYNIAASNGDTDAAVHRDELSKQMTATILAQAQKLARECVKKQYKGC